MGIWSVLLMTAVCLACVIAGAGLLHCRRWGYRTAIAILSLNLTGDTLTAIIAHDCRTLIGLPIGGTMLLYLVTKRKVLNC